MFDICFVDGVDDVIEYHVKAENKIGRAHV